MNVTVYLLLNPKREGARITSVLPTATTRMPGVRHVDAGAALLKLELTLPAGIFEAVEVPIEIPEDAVVKMQPVIVEAVND